MKQIRFVRFGGLSPVKQTQYAAYTADKAENWFHDPPARKGIYAFPEHYLEYFLIGSSSEPSHISGKSQWIKDYEGNYIKGLYDDFFPVNEEKIKLKPDLAKLIKRRKLKKKNLFLECDFKCPFTEDSDYCFHGSNCTIREECTQKMKIYRLAYLKKPRVFEHTGELWSHLGEHVKEWEKIKEKGSWVKTDYEVYLRAFKRRLHVKMKEHHKDFEQDYGKDFKEIDLSITDLYRTPYSPFSRDSLEVFIEKIKVVQ